MAALVACGKTILLQLNVLFKKCNGEKENNRPRGAIKISPPSYFLHSEIFSSSSSGPLPAGNYGTRGTAARMSRATNAPKGACIPSARRRPHPATFHCNVVTGHSGCRTASRGVSRSWRDPARVCCTRLPGQGHDSAGVVAIRSPQMRKDDTIAPTKLNVMIRQLLR